MYKSEVSSPRGTQQMHRPTFSDLMYSIGKRFQETMMRVSQNLQRSVQMQIESVRVSNSKIVQQLSQELKIISKQANVTKKADYEISNLGNKNEVRQGQEGVINEKLSQIHENIMRIQDNISSNKKQSRQRPFNIKLESITFKEGQERDHIIKKSVSRIISQVFSVGFNLFLKEKVDFDKVKVYCCEQFLYYLTGFITNNGLSCQQIQKIDIHLRNEVIPYLKLNYPYSQQKQACRQLVNRIVEFDRFNENEYDIVYRSGINISQVADDIDKQVMQILNYVIELPQKKITIHPQSNSSKEVNLYTAFQQDFNKIFKKVENRNWTSFFFNLNENLQKQKISNKEDLANLQKNILEKMKLQDDSFKKQAQEYKEKVKSYTHYKIGRKLSSNVEKYSEKQMKEGFLQIKDFAVARVLTKWIQSLEDYFNKSEKSTYERDEPFRLHDGSQIYEFPRVVFTSEFLNKRKKMIKEQMKILTNNLYETIQRTMKDTRNPKFKKLRQTCSDQDATLGHLSKVMVQSGQNYVCNYLKFLLGKVKQLQQQFFDQEQYRLYNNKNFLPALVNFKLGDLMRCLITSNERQIIALYEYLKLQCELQPEVFEMVRVKNRFGGPNKDILLNIFYRKSIMIQIQLAIKNQSSFLACSDKFNHFIYELGRVPFGPINQLCNVWTKYSPKSTFLDKKFRQLNSSSETVPSLCTEGKKHIFAPTNKSSLRLPYWCSLCQVFRTSGPNHETCYLCHKAKRCFSCKKLDCQDLIIKEMFDDYQKFEQNQFPSHGTLFVGFDLSADKVIQRYLIVMDINEVYYLLSAKASSTSTITVQNEQYDSVQLSQFKIQHKVTNLSDINAINKVFMRYLKNYILFKAKFKVNSHLIQQQTMEKFWIKSRMKTIFKDQKKTFNMQLKSSTMQKSNLMCKIDNQLAQNIQTLIKVEKIILRRDLLQGFPKALANLDNLQYLFIGDNSIAEIDISGMVHLKQLLIGQNLIESVSKIVGLKNAKQLRKIHIGRNRIKNCRGFPILSCLQQFEIISNGMNNFGQDFNFQNYPQLQKINLQKNEITNFDELQKLSEMKKLRSLDISLNLISRTESIPYIPNLQVLHLRKNKLMGVRGVGKLNKLKQLHLNFNRIDQIGQISQLKELEVLTMNYNIHLSNLKGIGSLVKLKRLHLCQNAIYKIDELKNLVNVEEMIICINDITDLSSLAYLKSLKILDASDNKLSDMSKLPTLQALQVLRLNSNQIQSFNGMPKLDRLKKLYLENNKISSLKGMPKLKQLQLLNISTNKIKNFVGMPSLYNLQKLQSNLNHIQSFQDLPALGSLCDLEVRNCGLTNLKGLAKFKHLQILSLSENLQMVQLYDILSLPILQQLSLSLNANSIGLLQTIMESKTLRTLEVVYGKQEKQQKVQKMLNKLQEKGIRVKLIQQD